VHERTVSGMPRRHGCGLTPLVLETFRLGQDESGSNAALSALHELLAFD